MTTNLSGVLDMNEVETAFIAALDQRDADRRNGFQPNEWAAISKEVYAWSRAKTYLAPFYCGLLARSVSSSADPLTLQLSDGGDVGSYNAHAVWGVVLGHAQGRVFLKNLKGAPFNNSPFNGKKRLEVDWANVSPSNRAKLARTVELMNHVSTMTEEEAQAALRSFLYAAPGPATADVFGASIDAVGVNLAVMFSEVEQFLLDNAENGRRGQALTAACFALLHVDSVDTPQSIHDPSRTAPGDVRVMREELPRLAHFAEAKQKVVQGEMLINFATEVRDFNALGSTGYAALVNRRVAEAGRARREVRLPDWRQVLEETGMLMSVWDNPADLIRDAIVWSALDVNTAAARLAALYERYLRHVEVDDDTIPRWREAAAKFGVTLGQAQDDDDDEDE